MDRIIEVTQVDFDAAARRLDEIDDLIRDVAGKPQLRNHAKLFHGR